MMAQMLKQVSLVRQSYMRCRSNTDFFTIFYGLFLKRDEAIAAMFKNTDWHKQKHLIQHAIKSAVLFAEEPYIPIIRKHIREIGESHSKYHLNVDPKYYPIWLDCMVETVRRCDPKFSLEVEKAWRQVLQPTIDLMISMYEQKEYDGERVTKAD